MAKKGKYADIIDDLPKDFGEEPERQEKLNAIKRDILGATPNSDKPPMASEAVEDFVGDIAAMMKVLNDELIQCVAGKHYASHFARVYRDLRKLKKVFAEQEKVTDLLIDAYTQLMVDQYEAEGITSLSIDDDGSVVRIQYEPHAKVTDKDAHRLWAIKEGLENSLMLPWPTTNALTKAALLRGEPEPDGVEAINRPKPVYTKGD